jgi:hypothetical protein
VNDLDYFTTVATKFGGKADVATTYTKTQTDTQISNIVGAAPELLNTLVELSAALGNDQNYATNVATALATKAPLASPTFTGGALTVSGSVANVAQNITNTSLNGFSSLYFNNTSGASASEVGRIFCGQSAGLNLCTNTAHPIKFTTYSSEPVGQFGSVLPSMQILANAERDVEINAPLKIKSRTTIVNNTLTVGVLTPTTDLAFWTLGRGLFNGDLQVDGNLTVNGTTAFANPHWVSVIITFVGSVPTITRNAGRYAATSLVRVPSQVAGYVQFDFPAHPQGLNYMVSFMTVGGYGSIAPSVRTSTRLGIAIRNPSGVVFDAETHVFISAY